MERKLEGKVALITGSGRGIGRELALMLAKDGAHIVVNDLDADPANQTVSDIIDMGGKAVACNGSVTDDDFAAIYQYCFRLIWWNRHHCKQCWIHLGQCNSKNG